MSAKPTHDLTIKIGEYTDPQTGEKKARWLTIGAVFKNEEGRASIKLDCIPIGVPDWNGWVNVFPRRDRQQGQGAPSDNYPQQSYQAPLTQRHQGDKQPAQPGSGDFDDDIPY